MALRAMSPPPGRRRRARAAVATPTGLRPASILVVGRPTRSCGTASASGSRSWPSWPTTAGRSWPSGADPVASLASGGAPGRRSSPVPGPVDGSEPGLVGRLGRLPPPPTGAKAASSVHRPASSSSEPHTPFGQPGQGGRPDGGGLHRCGPDHLEPGLVGHSWSRRSMADAPPSTRSTVGAVAVAAMASTTSRTWKLMASTMARARWARPVPRLSPSDGAPGLRDPSRGCRAR